MRRRVAIVGGGCAGLTTAYELTRPEHEGRYDVTVYQMGWRLGGKGASGRGAGDRIEEHGLHLWLGFYENAFRLMRECYAELDRDPFSSPIASWEDAFKPAPYVAVTDRGRDGDWETWVARFPPGDGMPGDDRRGEHAFSLGAYLTKAASLVVELLRSAEQEQAARSWGPRDPGERAPRRGSLTSPEGLVEGVEWVLRHGQLATAAALLEAAELLRSAIESWLPRFPGAGDGPLLRLIDAIAGAARRQLEMFVEGDTPLRRTWQVIDLILAIIRGSLKHGLAFNPQGFDAIDDYDWRQWLALHGASQASLDSGFVRGIYDLAFAYEHGDPRRPSLSAAAALRGAMRMFFTYRGSLFFRMSAGMGDIVFAPLYEVLKRRGVRFEFFHRLEAVEVSPPEDPEPHVTALRFDLQARIKGGEAGGKAGGKASRTRGEPQGTPAPEYQPLIDVKGLPCWPARPDYRQLVGGSRLQREGREFESPAETRTAGTRTLKVGEDFDFVVLALGGAAMIAPCARLIERAEPWRAMAEHMHCVATQACQVWLKQDMAALGWKHPPVNLSGWVEPFDTWADMSHLIPAERSREAVKAIAYFCSPLPDPGPGHVAPCEERHAEVQRRVRDAAVRFLDTQIGALWPGAVDASSGFRWELLATESTGDDALEGAARFDTQFWTGNVRPSDRYTLCLPGTSRYRLSPLDRSFDNLTVAGDWTASGLNTGCVESAVMSGLLAAHALCSSPKLEDIIGYDHP